MKNMAVIQYEDGANIEITYDFESSLFKLVERDDIDFIIVSTALEFSPLGKNLHYFSNELNIDGEDISNLANWNRYENMEVSFIVLPSRNPLSKLRGLIIAANENSKCYEQYESASSLKRNRDFHYNVAYESISYAARVLGAQKISMSHLSSSGHFHEETTTFVAEALADFCDFDGRSKIDRFLFVGCCMNEKHFSGIKELNSDGNASGNNITTSVHNRNGFEVINLIW